MEELRCVLAVIRHGDRTPKQKMKMKVTQVLRPHMQCIRLHMLQHAHTGAAAKGFVSKLQLSPNMQCAASSASAVEDLPHHSLGTP